METAELRHSPQEAVTDRFELPTGKYEFGSGGAARCDSAAKTCVHDAIPELAVDTESPEPAPERSRRTKHRLARIPVIPSSATRAGTSPQALTRETRRAVLGPAATPLPTGSGDDRQATSVGELICATSPATPPTTDSAGFVVVPLGDSSCQPGWTEESRGDLAAKTMTGNESEPRHASLMGSRGAEEQNIHRALQSTLQPDPEVLPQFSVLPEPKPLRKGNILPRLPSSALLPVNVSGPSIASEASIALDETMDLVPVAVELGIVPDLLAAAAEAPPSARDDTALLPAYGAESPAPPIPVPVPASVSPRRQASPVAPRRRPRTKVMVAILLAMSASAAALATVLVATA